MGRPEEEEEEETEDELSVSESLCESKHLEDNDDDGKQK